MILSQNIDDQKIFLFFSLRGNSIPNLVHLSGHWRWVFWLLLVAFGASVLQVPAAIFQFVGVLPDPYPLWYSLIRMGVAIVEVGIAVWMIRIYRRAGVWAMDR